MSTSSVPANSAPAGNWQGDLLVKLLVRDRREKAFTDFVESCKFYKWVKRPLCNEMGDHVITEV